MSQSVTIMCGGVFSVYAFVIVNTFVTRLIEDKVTVSIGEVVEAIGKQKKGKTLDQTTLIVRPTYMVVLG